MMKHLGRAIFNDFSKWSRSKVLKNFEKSSNMANVWQKKKKSLVQLAFNPFLGKISSPLIWSKLKITHIFSNFLPKFAKYFVELL